MHCKKKKCFLLQVEVLDKKHLRPIMQMVLVWVQTITVENVLAPTMGQVNAVRLYKSICTEIVILTKALLTISGQRLL